MIKSSHVSKIMVLIFTCTFFPAWVNAETLADHFSSVRSEKAIPPSQTEQFIAEGLFRRLLTGESGPAIRREWAKLGFELTGTLSESDPLLILQEFSDSPTENSYTGKGFFVISTNRESNIVVQSTHSFKDAESADIALQLIANKNILAAAWNTAPVEDHPHPVIPPHNPPSKTGDYITAFTKAVMTTLPKSHVVQIHSFEEGTVHSKDGKESDIILSGYGDQLNQFVGLLNQCFKKDLEYRIRTFPFEVREMGAANNTPGAAYNPVGEILSTDNNHNFAHVSFGDSFRKELRTYQSDREKTFSCFTLGAS